MTAATNAKKCSATQWTLLTTGKQNVSVRVRGQGIVYLRTGAALPSDTPTADRAAIGTMAGDFATVTPDSPGSFEFSDTTTNIYAYAPYSDVIVEVISE